MIRLPCCSGARPAPTATHPYRLLQVGHVQGHSNFAEFSMCHPLLPTSYISLRATGYSNISNYDHSSFIVYSLDANHKNID